VRRWIALALLLLPTAIPAADSFFLHRQILSRDGVRLHLVEAGPPQAPAVLFIPGWSLPWDVWEGTMRRLSAHWRVIGFDPRCQGASQVVDQGLDSESRAGDLAQVLSSLDLRRPVLVGWSLGAVEVVRYLQLTGTAELSGVVLVDNSVDRNFSPPAPSRRLLEEMSQPDIRVPLKNFMASLCRKPLAPERLEAWYQQALAVPPRVSRRILSEASTGGGLSAGLRHRQLPVLLAVTPKFRRQAEALARRYPSVKSSLYREEGHALFLDAPERFNRELEDFLSSVFPH
jgi:pimeloyl-ACP methyl ester carboxylesterase